MNGSSDGALVLPLMLRRDDTDDAIGIPVVTVTGLPLTTLDGPSAQYSNVPLIFQFDDTQQFEPTLALNVLYALVAGVGTREIAVAYFVFRRFESMGGGAIRCTTSIGQSDAPLLQIIQCWAGGEPIEWRSLDPSWSGSWVTACRAKTNSVDWRQDWAGSRIPLSIDVYRTNDDFYCAVGEAFFGYGGYAGGNLDALRDVLIDNRSSGVEIQISDAAGLSVLLAGRTERPDYFDQFVEVLRESGLRVSF